MSDNLAHQLEKSRIRPSLGASLENSETPPTISNEDLVGQLPPTQEQDINRRQYQARRNKKAIGQTATGTAMRAGGKGVEMGGKMATAAGGAIGQTAGGAVGAAGGALLGGATGLITGGPAGAVAGAKTGANIGWKDGSKIGQMAGRAPGQIATTAGRDAQAAGIRRQRNAARSAIAKKTKASNIKEKSTESIKNATGIDASKGIGAINPRDLLKHKINLMVLTPLWLGIIVIKTAPLAMIGLDAYLAISLLMPKAPIPQFGEDMILGKMLRTGGSKEFAKIIEIIILVVVNVLVIAILFILFYIIYKFATVSYWGIIKGTATWLMPGKSIEDAMTTALDL